MVRSRREFLSIAAAAGIAFTAACSRSESADRQTDSGPATLRHLFGETTVPGPPGRVVSAGLTEHDDLLAVGVVPVAVTKWFGDQPSGVWPWAQARLGSATPAVLDLDNGIQVDAIAKLKPDLIIAINAGLDADTYQKLSAIAPTIAQSGHDAFFEPWKDQATQVGRAVYKSDEMAQVLTAVDERFAAVAQANPAFKEHSAALMNIGVPVDPVADVVSGWRTDFLSAMGLDVATAPADADLLIWSTDSEDQRGTLLADPAVAKLRATRLGRNVFTTTDLAAAIAYGTPLSYPLVADQLPTLLAEALN